MDTGNIKRNIIINPENYEEMIEKLEARGQERMEALTEKKGVKTPEELMQVAAKELSSRAQRSSPGHKPLKDHTVKTEAQSPEIQALKQQLNAEITAFAKERLTQVSPAEKPEGLKGRVTSGAPEKAGEPKTPQ